MTGSWRLWLRAAAHGGGKCRNEERESAAETAPPLTAATVLVDGNKGSGFRFLFFGFSSVDTRST
ncbi:hypothetical protein HanPI659440_Chr03g0124271 [Helianthus annuus]|nr:hypothetical protein HanPI659440_Chr03g0124271 [Helianthus annuus]